MFEVRVYWKLYERDDCTMPLMYLFYIVIYQSDCSVTGQTDHWFQEYPDKGAEGAFWSSGETRQVDSGNRWLQTGIQQVYVWYESENK